MTTRSSIARLGIGVLLGLVTSVLFFQLQQGGNQTNLRGDSVTTSECMELGSDCRYTSDCCSGLSCIIGNGGRYCGVRDSSASVACAECQGAPACSTNPTVTDPTITNPTTTNPTTTNPTITNPTTTNPTTTDPTTTDPTTTDPTTTNPTTTNPSSGSSSSSCVPQENHQTCANECHDAEMACLSGCPPGANSCTTGCFDAAYDCEQNCGTSCGGNDECTPYDQYIQCSSSCSDDAQSCRLVCGDDDTCTAACQQQFIACRDTCGDSCPRSSSSSNSSNSSNSSSSSKGKCESLVDDNDDLAKENSACVSVCDQMNQGCNNFCGTLPPGDVDNCKVACSEQLLTCQDDCPQAFTCSSTSYICCNELSPKLMCCGGGSSKPSSSNSSLSFSNPTSSLSSSKSIVSSASSPSSKSSSVHSSSSVPSSSAASSSLASSSKTSSAASSSAMSSSKTSSTTSSRRSSSSSSEPKADLVVIKTAPTTLSNNTAVFFDYVITISNASSVLAENVTVNDQIPSELVIVGSLLPAECKRQGFTNIIRCDYASLGSAQIVIHVSAPARSLCDKRIINNVAAMSQTPDRNPNNNFDSATTSFTCTPQSSSSVSVKSSASSTPPRASSASSSTNSSVTVASSSSTVSPSSSKSSSLSSALSSSVSPSSSKSSSLSSALSSSVSNSRVVDLSILKRGYEFTQRGQEFSYYLDVTNYGPSPVRAASVFDQLPSGVSYLSSTVSGDGATCSTTNAAGGGTSLQCNFPLLESGETQQIVVNVIAYSYAGTCVPAVLSNTATITENDSSVIETNLTNNRSTFVTRIGCENSSSSSASSYTADLDIYKSAYASAIRGREFVYYINVKNYGPSSVDSARVIDTLPSGVSYVSHTVSGTAAVCTQYLTNGRTTLQCDYTSLPSGASSNINITVRTTDTGTACTETVVNNEASITEYDTRVSDPKLSNNRSTANTTITCPPKGSSSSSNSIAVTTTSPVVALPTVTTTVTYPTTVTPTVAYPTVIAPTIIYPTVIASTVIPTNYSFIFCGDGIVQKERGEQCDAGSANGQKSSNCSLTCQQIFVPTCGNGIIDKGEECDDGNSRDLDACSNQCQNRSGRCGDGIVDRGAGEQCDSGNENGRDSSLCTTECKSTVTASCGNGKTEDAEECDDGTLNGNYPETTCLKNCKIPYCGDGVVELLEQCDDGNMFDFDGCDHTCMFETIQTAAEQIGQSGGPLVGNLTGNSGYYDTSGKYYGNIPTPARTPTGPGLVIFLASGAAAGIGLVRRRYMK